MWHRLELFTAFRMGGPRSCIALSLMDFEVASVPIELGGFGVCSERVAAFLLSTPRERSWQASVQALWHFRLELKARDVVWAALSAAERDAFLSDYVLEQMEEGTFRQQCVTLVAALHKFLPSERFRTASAVLVAWNAHLPPRQAPAAPREVACAIAIALAYAGQLPMGCALRLCFVGLLRISEALALRWRQVLFLGPTIVLWLGTTKRGLDQKVAVEDATMVEWLERLRERRAPCAPDGRVFDFTYSRTMLAAEDPGRLAVGAAAAHIPLFPPRWGLRDADRTPIDGQHHGGRPMGPREVMP